MRTSESVGKIFPAYIAAQARMGKLVKDADNPFFKSQFASLEQVLEVVKPVFLENEIAIIQGSGESKNGINTVTRLIHTSGEWIETDFPIPLSKNDAQAAGSASSYSRRYSLKAIACLAEVDDDGNGGSDPEPKDDRTEDSMKPITDKQKSQIVDMFASIGIEDEIPGACLKCSSKRTQSIDGLMESEAKRMLAKLKERMVAKSSI